MKIFKISIFFMALAVLFSCSKDDDNPPVPPVEEPAGIEGEWQLEEYDYSGSSSVSHQEFTYTTGYEAVAKNINVKLIIETEPNTWQTEGNYTLELTTIADGETQVREIVVNNLGNAGSFILDENQFFPDNQNESFPDPGEINPMDMSTFTIDELTASRLVLSFSERHSSTENGMQAETVIEGRQVYSR